MQVQSRCFETLSEFNPRIHYLKVKYNRVVYENKSDLSFIQRVIRFFWKPLDERINFVMTKILEKLRDESLPVDFEELSDAVLKLEHLYIKAAPKGYNRYFISQMQMIRKKIYVVEYQDELEEQCKGIRNKHQTKLARLQEEIESEKLNLKSFVNEKNNRVDELQKEIKELKKQEQVLDKMVEKSGEELKQELALRTKLKDQIDGLEIEIQKLAAKKKWLEHDTVLWTKEGYVLVNSACFSPDSPLNLPSHSSMPQLSKPVQEKLKGIEGIEAETAASLRSMKKHVYLENISLRHVKLALQILQEGSTKGKNALLLTEIEAMKVLADYLLEPDLLKKINSIIPLKPNKTKLSKEKVQSQSQLQPQPAPSLSNNVISHINQLQRSARDLAGRAATRDEVQNFFARFLRLKLN